MIKASVEDVDSRSFSNSMSHGSSANAISSICLTTCITEARRFVLGILDLKRDALLSVMFATIRLLVKSSPAIIACSGLGRTVLQGSVIVPSLRGRKVCKLSFTPPKSADVTLKIGRKQAFSTPSD